MADKKITELTALTTAATDDILAIVDVSDTTDATSGTTKKITVANVKVTFDTLTEQVEPASDTLSTAQCYDCIINNYGQVADAVIQLPTIAAGMEFLVLLGTTVAKYYRVKAATNDKIYLDGAAGSDNGYVGVASAAAGNCIQFVAFQTGSGAYDWYAATISGSWIAG